MKSAAFSPAHITGFFKIYKHGSTGAGITLRDGMSTKITLTSGKDVVKINGKNSTAPVSKNVIKRYKNLAGNFAVHVNHKTRVPIGYGLGMSAAGALSLSLALSDCLGIVTPREAKKIAHLAEIECKTGLGGVIAESTGGLVIRKKPGSFKAEKVPLQNKELHCFFLSPINTKKIITSEKWKQGINKTANFCQNEFLKTKDLPHFIELSRFFSLQTGLATSSIRKLLLEHDNSGMAMLGNTIFFLGKKPNLKKYSISTRLTNERARVL